MKSRQCRISQGVVDAPPPPLAGALAAWLQQLGWQVRVVDPRGGPVTWSGAGPLWIHLDRGFPDSRLADGLEGPELRFFGPALSDSATRTRLAERFPAAVLVTGDPEPTEQRIEDLSTLPLTTYHGFGPQPGSLFRILAGRGDRQRPLEHLCREIVYLVETFAAGHLLFDDQDLARYPGWLDAFRSELLQMPWRITWEGTVEGGRVREQGRPAPEQLP